MGTFYVPINKQAKRVGWVRLFAPRGEAQWNEKPR
jgi:hypothetical protein